jgi:26S protease regulatory subunit 10B
MATVVASPTVPKDQRGKILQDYRKKLMEHQEVESRLKECELIFFCFFYCFLFVIIFLISFVVSAREQLKEVNKQYQKSEADLKALQSMGQIVGEVLKQLTEDNCKYQF